MIIYKVIKNEVITNQWTSDFADESYYEPCFGKPERWVRESEEDISEALDTREVEDQPAHDEIEAITHTEYKLAAEYTIEQEDVGNAPLMAALREQRNMKLAACDWTQLADASLDSEQKTDWATYRQALRDLPQQEGLDPANPTWPEQP